MTSSDRTGSRRGSAQSERLSSDGRERPRAPMGPRTPQRSGSSRTHYSVTPAAATPAPPTEGARGSGGVAEDAREIKISTSPQDLMRQFEDEATTPPTPDTNMLSPTASPTATAGTSVQVMSAAQSEMSEPEQEVLPAYDAGYRSPEAVVEHIEDNGSLPPGIVDATFDDKAWDEHEATSFHPEHPERPQIGPGRMALRWLADLHPHELWQPTIHDLPRPSKSPSASPISPLVPLDRTVPSTPGITIEDVLSALPGGKENHYEWFFCPECWGWIRIVVGSGDFPAYRGHQDRIPAMRSGESPEAEQQAWWVENSRLRDIALSRSTAPHDQKDHYHTFERLLDPAPDVRIPRVVVEGLTEAFSHLNPAYGEIPTNLVDYELDRVNKTELHVSCSTDSWVTVSGPTGGQLPKALAAEWTDQKRNNPEAGLDGVGSAITAWQLVVTLLQNPLFKDMKGWVKMSNNRFLKSIGPSLRSMGFSCQESVDGYIVGPFKESETTNISEADVEQMYRYMVRTWVEVSMYLQAFQRANKREEEKPFITATPAREVLDRHTLLSHYRLPTMSPPWGAAMKGALTTLGLTSDDAIETVEIAYDFQVSEDHANVASYFSALEQLSNTHVEGVDALRIKVAMQRSLDRFSHDDLDLAYALVGLDNEHLENIMVQRTDLPAEYIYERHREAMDRALDAQQRLAISNALVIVAKDRGDSAMQNLGKEGGTHLTLEQAYKEFNLERNSNIDNEMLILQYQTWITDRPSKTDHYRLALSVIANAPGEQRPQLQAFLEGKDISEFQGPVRKDIPAGLKNIGNTCYLNSVLQFLYAVKPIREAVMSFVQATPEAPLADEDDKAMEKRIKLQSSRRFVEMLGELFRQMYETDQSAVVPAEELARLAILPIDLVDQRRDAVPFPRGQITIDSLPTVLASPTSSGVATAADTAPPTPTSPTLSPTISLGGSPPNPRSPHRRTSVLGKRASEDRESTFGGSEERLRRLTQHNVIEVDSPTPGSPASTLEAPRDDDVEMMTDPPTREGSDLSPADAGISGLDLTSPMGEKSDPAIGPLTPKVEPRGLGIVTPAATPPAPAAPAPPMNMMEALRGIPPPLPPRRRSLALVAAEKFGLQQDAAEILINVLAQLEYAFDGPEGGNLIQKLFSAKFRQQMLLQSENGLAESHPPVESVFVHPIIGVEEDDKDLYDCLAELYLGGAEIEYDGKKGFKMDLLDELPPALYILMRRSQYDFVKGRQTKTNTHIPFGNTLVMDRFLAGADSAKREASIACTRKMMRMRARRHELKSHKPLAIPETYRFVRDALGDDKVLKALLDSDVDALDSDISSELLDALGAQADKSEAEIATLEHDLVASKAELEAMWAAEKEVEYELVSVFVHGGTGTGGHYWTYQAGPPSSGDKFFYYSDENVKDVPSTEVFADKSAQGVSPALLVYVRKGQGLVDTLHRKDAPDEAGVDAEASASGAGASGGVSSPAGPVSSPAGPVSGPGAGPWPGAYGGGWSNPPTSAYDGGWDATVPEPGATYGADDMPVPVRGPEPLMSTWHSIGAASAAGGAPSAGGMGGGMGGAGAAGGATWSQGQASEGTVTPYDRDDDEGPMQTDPPRQQSVHFASAPQPASPIVPSEATLWNAGAGNMGPEYLPRR